MVGFLKFLPESGKIHKGAQKHMKKIIFTSLFISIFSSVLIVKGADQSVLPFTSTLRYGMKNNAGVIHLQKFLKDRGYFSGPTNGSFGPLTLNAVKKFQSANRVSATGLWGPLSRAAANDILNRQRVQSIASVPTTPTTTPSSTGATTTPLSITTTYLPPATAGTAYSVTLSAFGGNGSYSWWVSDGSLPAGLNLVPTQCTGSSCPKDATIFGTPVSAWTYNFTITVTSGTQVAMQQFALIINPSVANLRLSQTSAINLNNGQTFEIKAFYTPAPNCYPTDPCYAPDATQVKVDWASSDNSIAAVAYKFYDNTAGVITGKSPGNATITANYTVGGASFSASVPVFVAGTIGARLQISLAAPSVSAGNTVLLQAVYYLPTVCSSGSCASGGSSVVQAAWTSNNNAVATAVYKSDDPKTAVVTGISPGVATITAVMGYNPDIGSNLTATTGLVVTPVQ